MYASDDRSDADAADADAADADAADVDGDTRRLARDAIQRCADHVTGGLAADGTRRRTRLDSRSRDRQVIWARPRNGGLVGWLVVPVGRGDQAGEESAVSMSSTHPESDDSASVNVTEGSRLVAATRAVGDWVRHSALYRWLTKEPEPDVIVIDLRETYTVGPIIALLDRLGARLSPWWRASGCRQVCVQTGAWLTARPVRALGVVVMVAATLGVFGAVAGGTLAPSTLAVWLAAFALGAVATRSRHSWQDIQATRAYQLVAGALEPPVPPADARATESGDDSAGVEASQTDDPGRDQQT